MRGASVVLLIAALVGVAAGQYVESDAITAVRYAGASYCKASDIEAWNCPSCKLLPSTSAQVVYSAASDTQAFVGWDSANARLWIVFRGTNPLSIQDWIDDLTFEQTNPYTACPACGVHQGFDDSWMDLRDGVFAATRKVLAANSNATVHITGHSLGAAMAQLCAVDLSVLAGINATTVYTFGEPRVGNPQFASWYQSIITEGTYRLVHNADPVPHLPLEAMDFRHEPTEVFYSENQDSYKVCDASGEDKTCSDGLLIPLWVPDHLNYLSFDFTANYLDCAL